jgi:hypothetical protein
MKLTKEWLYQKYIVEQKNQYEMAKEAEKNQSEISRKLKKFGIRLPGELLRVRYALSKTGDRNPGYGKKMSDSVRKKISLKTRGENNPNWTGGRQKTSRGYILVYCPDHPLANNRGRVYEHRLVAEKMLGRYLGKEEIVHHLNEIRDDNRPENIFVCRDAIHHKSMHKIISKSKDSSFICPLP